MAVADMFLGIETSCDETAAAVVSSDGKIYSNIIASQIDDHARHGGVVPEVAARAHLTLIDKVVEDALSEAGIGMDEIQAVAATGGPGLIGGVLVGTMAAKAISLGCDIPFFAINHLEGHALTARLTAGVPFPYLMLLVSGGHTQLLAVKGPGKYVRYGTTLDDAAGEAFDKSAQILGLGMPGGPKIELAARSGNDRAFSLPRPLENKPGCHFSFSGMKTAIRTAYLKYIEPLPHGEEREAKVADLAASLERAIAESLSSRSERAMRQFSREHRVMNPAFVVAGGVGANAKVRARLQEVAEKHEFTFHAPPPKLCTDNAVMIAWAAIERQKAGDRGDALTFTPRPRWPLDPDAVSPAGRGVRQ
ncbi:tRNA (adenosine(37)-N6)-threonylcarbamoyltransferase complex transferase subunit TsaD [Alphaproteobacteria bacterium LSUCC0684]